MERCQEFIRSHPADRWTWLAYLKKGEAYGTLLKYDEAEKAYRSAISVRPSGEDWIVDLVEGRIARLRFGRIRRALQSYYGKEVRYPGKLDDLVADGHLEERSLRDPWGRSYHYEPIILKILPEFSYQSYRLICLGADGHEGGDHDLVAEGSGKVKGIPQVKEFVRNLALLGVGGGAEGGMASIRLRNEGKSVTVRKGDTLGGAKVMAVEKDGLLLLKDGELIVLSL